MSFWVIVSWVFVLILTGVNIFLFLKLKSASEQMLKMAFPNAKNMGEAMAGMQSMMSGMQGMASPRGGGVAKGFGNRPGQALSQDAQLKAAMDMLKKMQNR